MHETVRAASPRDQPGGSTRGGRHAGEGKGGEGGECQPRRDNGGGAVCFRSGVLMVSAFLI